MLIIRTNFKTIVEKASTNFMGFSIDCPHPHPHRPIFPLLLSASNKQVNCLSINIAFYLYTLEQLRLNIN